VTGIALTGRGQDRSVSQYATVPLPAGAVVPTLTADNIVDRVVVGQAVQRVLEELGRPKRVALVVPDGAAKVSFVRFDKVPPRADDLAQMVRWQVRKAVPFPIESAQIGFMPSLDLEGGGREFVVVVMRRDVVESYESLVQGAGAHPGIVDLASFDLVNLVLAADQRGGRVFDADWLLVHLTPHASTLGLVRAGQLVFYRSRVTDGQEPLVDLVHQTAMYYEDRLGGRGFGRVVLAAAAEALAVEGTEVRRTLEERLRSGVEILDASRAVRLGDQVPAGADDRLAMTPALGVLLREVA
jgi:type IV pilus assembly protein PilM